VLIPAEETSVNDGVAQTRGNPADGYRSGCAVAVVTYVGRYSPRRHFTPSDK
jgi:hypothetical protein